MRPSRPRSARHLRMTTSFNAIKGLCHGEERLGEAGAHLEPRTAPLRRNSCSASERISPLARPDYDSARSRAGRVYPHPGKCAQSADPPVRRNRRPQLEPTSLRQTGSFASATGTDLRAAGYFGGRATLPTGSYCRICTAPRAWSTSPCCMIPPSVRQMLAVSIQTKPPDQRGPGRRMAMHLCGP